MENKEILNYYTQPLVKYEKEIIGFKIYYGNNDIYTARGSYSYLFDEWKKAPYENIQIIMLYEKGQFGDNKRHYRKILSGYDYYLFNGKYFMSCNDTRQFPKIPKNSLKYGWYMNIKEYEKIREKAMKVIRL